jgi:CheY-like chemotaxis protein
MALCDRLLDRGASIVGPGATLREATELAEAHPVDLALLDVDLGGEFSFPLARALRARGVPIIFMTGYDCSIVPHDLRDLPLFDKLGSMADLASTAALALQAASPRR